MGYCHKFDDFDTRDVWICSLVTALLSVFGSSFMLNSFFTFGKRNKGSSSLVALLAASDLGWSMSATTSLIIILKNGESVSVPECLTMRFAFQFFAGSCVLWCVCISWFLYHSMRQRAYTSSKSLSIVELKKIFNTVTPKMWISFFSISYGIPLLFICILIAGNDFSHSDHLVMCYPKPLFHVLFWFAPNILAILFQMVCLVLIVRRTNQLRSVLSERYPLFKPQRETLPVQVRVSLYAVVFLICWSLDILYWALHYLNGGQCQNYPLFFIYNVLINAHGFLDSIVYGVTNGAIRQKYSEKPLVAFFTAIFSPIILPFTFASWILRIFSREGEEPNEKKKMINRQTSKLWIVHSDDK